VERAANGLDALRLIDELAPDVVFLDIRMPGLNGLQLAERLRDDAAGAPRAPHVVFTTAHEHYALQAFEHAAFDYLLKPVRRERLERTVARLQEALAAATPGVATPGVPVIAPASTPGVPPLQWIRAAQGQETRLIAVDEVMYFQSNDKYTSVFIQDGEHLIRTPLRQLREQLDPQ
jgi:DNA-binding LytR/AlgR family response regulator